MIDNLIARLFDRYSSDQSTAFCIDQGSISFAELKQQSFFAAEYFRTQGIKPGETVALFCEETMLWPVAWYGLILLGAVPLSIPLSNDRGFLKDIDASVIITDDIDASLPIPQLVLDRRLIEHGVPLENIHQHDPDDVILCLLSSGTSGNQKIIQHRCRGLMASFAETANPYGLAPQSRVYCSVKLSSSWGMIMGLLGNLAVGYTVVTAQITRDFHRLDEILAQHAITHAMIPPRALLFMYEHCSQLPSSLDRIYVSGEFCPPELIRKFQERFGITALDSYGCAEIRCWVVLVNHPDHYRVGSLGVAGPGVEIKIVSHDGHEVSTGEIGRAIIGHPGVFVGYKNQPEINARCLDQGWYITQDYMKKDPDGFYYYVGRESDIADVDGKFTTVFDLESRISQILKTKDLVVVVRDNQKIAFLPRADYTTSQTSDVYDLVDQIYFVTEIPVTPGSGKRSRNFEDLKKYVVEL